MKETSEYRTQTSYDREAEMSGAMEDYLEMLTRLSHGGLPVRIRDIAHALNVSPSSASRMMSQLAGRELAEFERYGYVMMTDAGREMGMFLIKRHKTVNALLCLINEGDCDDLEETERLEHYFSRRTVENIERFLEKYGGGG